MSIEQSMKDMSKGLHDLAKLSMEKVPLEEYKKLRDITTRAIAQAKENKEWARLLAGALDKFIVWAANKHCENSKYSLGRCGRCAPCTSKKSLDEQGRANEYA